jgi:uncharacterized protein YggU (UPF0235/DUF167 family)
MPPTRGRRPTPQTTTPHHASGTPVTVAVRVKPGSSRARVGGSFTGPYGPALVVAVNAPAVDGRATEAARVALAAALGVRPAAVALRTGAASRDKLFLVEGDGTEIEARLERLRAGE